METLARYRKGIGTDQLRTALAEIKNAGPDHTAFGTVPGSWLTKRSIGSAAIRAGRYADIYSSEWLAHLRREFEPELLRSGCVQPGDVDFDLALLMSRNRSLTQEIATSIYELGFDGIRYQSRFGHDLFNWALFEPFELSDASSSELNSDDRDFREALKRLDLSLDERL